MTTRPPSSSSRSNRKDNHDRRLVSQDVALPNSSRRSSARKSRSGGTASSSTKNGFAITCNEGNVCVCGRCATKSISYRTTTTTKKSSSSSSDIDADVPPKYATLGGAAPSFFFKIPRISGFFSFAGTDLRTLRPRC
jgi:hypothetical protein